MKLIINTIVLTAIAIVLGAPADAENAEQILQKTRDLYGALKSYSDSGVVVREYGASTQDRHTFTTVFNRTPRHFVLDFRKQGGDQYVIWGDPDAFHTWWKTTGQQYDYPNPNNAPAIALSSQNTAGSALKIPTLLYSKASLGGNFNNYTDVELDGTEEIGGRRCYRLIGRASDVYQATGREVAVRRMTVWIDAESSLIRQIREETKGLPGQISRDTTTYQPNADTTIDIGRFKFAPPESK
jgi:outer membrane lipoprotein-sorting protein